MTVFYFIGIFEAFFLGLLLLLKKRKNKSDRYLASYFLMFGINILFVYVENYNIEHNYSLFPYTFISPPLLLLHGPLLWFYAKSLTSLNFALGWKNLTHFIPFVLLAPHILMLFNGIPAEQRLEAIRSEIFVQWWFYKFYVSFITVSIFTYLIWSISLLVKFQKNIVIKHIETAINFRWIIFFFTITLIIYGVTLPINVLDIFFDFVSFKNYQYISYLIASLFIPIIGFFGHLSENVIIYEAEIDGQNLGKEHKNIIRKETEKQIFIESLYNFIDKEKPYTLPDLSLHKLANMLSVTPEYLSEIINNDLNKNFLDFINTLRVEEFKKRLQHDKNQNRLLIDIAYEVGFNSKATFNRVFKNKTTLTPSEYKTLVSKK